MNSTAERGRKICTRTRIRKWSVIAAVTAFAIFAVADLVYDFVANDPIGYVSPEPYRFLYIAVIAIAGGLATFGFYPLSPPAQRDDRMFSWGAAASTMTGVLGFALF